MLRASFLFLLFIVLNSQTTRSVSMGNVGNFMHDISNIRTFSGTLLDYSNTSNIEMSEPKNYDTYRFFSQLKLSETNGISILLNQPVNISQLGFNRVPGSLALDKRAEIYYSTKNGQNSNISFGFMIARDGQNEKDSGGSDTEENTTISDIGLRFGTSSTSFDFDAQLHFLNSEYNFEDDNSPNADETHTTSGIAVNVAGRRWNKVSDKLSTVLVASLYYQKTKHDKEHVDNYNKISDSQFKISIAGALNFQYDENNLVVAALELISYTKTMSEWKENVAGPSTMEIDRLAYTANQFLPSIYFGVESKLNSWLVTRFGVKQNYQTITSGLESSSAGRDDTVDEISKNYSNFNAVFGLGFKKNNLEIDFVFNESLLFNGPNVLSGSSNTFANRMSLTYTF